MKRLRSHNPQLIENIRILNEASRANKARIWSRIADDLSKSGSRRVRVNLSRINNVGLEVTLPAENTPTQKAIRVYAHNYNILRVQSGVAGVLFNFRQN